MKEIIYDAAVIGAGASGLLAAVTAARKGCQVILLEHMEQAGKKILATGNGRCNYTNADLSLDNYYCEKPEFVQTVLTQFSNQDAIHFFEELGVRPVQKNGTCIYPESGQASSVRNVLLAELERLNVPIRLSAAIRSIHKLHPADFKGCGSGNLFEIQTKKQPVFCRACILAAGAMAAKKTGSDGSGYIYAKQLGHTVKKPLPALTALVAEKSGHMLPAGVRTDCRASLFTDGRQKASERGELQITDYGISGIVIFQFSRIAARALDEGSRVQVSLDFKPDIPQQQLADYITSRFQGVFTGHKKCRDALEGFVPDKLAAALLKRSGIPFDGICRECSTKQVFRLAGQMKDCRITITGTRNFDSAQAVSGGIPVTEIHAQSMESRLVRGLYFAGEIIDVDAKCGGYNLQWAWSSGYTAGRSIQTYDTSSADKGTPQSQQG